MAAYAALLSLAQTTVAIRNQERYHLSIEVEEEIRSIHEYVTLMLSFFEDFPENAKSLEFEGRIRDIAHEIEDIIEKFMWESKFIRTEPPSMDLEYQLEYLEGRYPMGTQMLWRFLRRRPPSLNLGKLRGATREICDGRAACLLTSCINTCEQRCSNWFRRGSDGDKGAALWIPIPTPCSPDSGNGGYR